MRKVLLLLTAFVGLAITAQAQFPTVTVQDIQTVTAMDLANCIDVPSLSGDTVVVTGVVVTPPDSNYLTDNNSGQIWIRSGYGPFSGLDIYQGFDPSQNGLTSLLPGDSVAITGVVTEFGHESELVAIPSVQIQILNAGATIAPTTITTCDLNNANQENQLTTGEPLEGSYVQLNDVTVTSVGTFSGGTRVSFIVQDANGCVVNISDRFLVQKLPNGNPAGTFVAPNVGDQYDYIRGVVAHSANGCTGAGGRGYEIFPVLSTDYKLNDSLSCPTISGLMRNLTTPTSTQAVTISVDVEDLDGVASVDLYYAVGETNNNYTNVSMTLSSGTATNGTYTADIPANADGSFVKYYICSADVNGNSCCSPDVPGTADPAFYTVRDNGTTIFDVQYVPTSFSNASSGYVDMQVTVEGVVTGSAEANNLGFVFIQQENQLAWAGIMLTDNPSLATLQVGQKVSVTGTVRETFGFTRIEQVSAVSVAGTGTITPLLLNPALFTSPFPFPSQGEAFEGMLVRFGDTNGPIYVVDQNPDTPSNFAEYRLGTDPFNPGEGCRVLAGRVTNSSYSSLNVSYVNDVMWETTDGIMNVPSAPVMAGDQYDWVQGVIAYTFGNFKLLPRNDMDFMGGVGIEDGLSHTVNAYPNPVSDIFRVDYTFAGTQLGARATVTDLMGRTLKTVELNELTGQASIDLSSLSAGTYVLQVVSETSGLIENVKFNKVR